MLNGNLTNGNIGACMVTYQLNVKWGLKVENQSGATDEKLPVSCLVSRWGDKGRFYVLACHSHSLIYLREVSNPSN